MKSYSFVFALAAILMISAVSGADVVVRSKSSADMSGMMSTQTDGIDNIKGDKSHNSTTTLLTGGMASMFGKVKPQEMVNITRLDKGVRWDLNPENKSYKETSIADLKKELSESRGENEKPEEPEYNWTVDVKSIDAPQTINGFNCNGAIGKATGVSKKDPADSMFITYEQWSAKDVPGAAEVEAYQQNYARAVGVDPIWAKENMGTMLKDYGAEFTELAIKVSQAGRYPIKTVITIEGASKPGNEGAGEGSAGAMGMMSKMLGKKAEKSEGEKVGRTKAFSMSHEIISIEQKNIPDSQFDIPADYKKK